MKKEQVLFLYLVALWPALLAMEEDEGFLKKVQKKKLAKKTAKETKELFESLASPQYLKQLLEKGVEVNCRCTEQVSFYKGAMPLHKAVDSHQVDAQSLQLLLEHGADPNAPTHADESGDTPLHIAIKRGSLKNVQMLLHHGASPKKSNNYGQTPLDVAKEQWEKVQKILPDEFEKEHEEHESKQIITWLKEYIAGKRQPKTTLGDNHELVCQVVSYLNTPDGTGITPLMKLVRQMFAEKK